MTDSENERRERNIPTIVPSQVELIDTRRNESYSASPPFAPPRPPIRTRKRRAFWLFILTCLSVFLVGMRPGGGLSGFYLFVAILIEGQSYHLLPQLLVNGATYALAVIGILGAHEMGHYLQARRYHVPASLPFFIPFPISPLGTMGALIVQEAGVADRKAMFDIAISGPLAGLVMTAPILWFGLASATSAFFVPHPSSIVFGDPPLITWLYEWMHGPKPAGHEILLDNNPLLFAGWVGVFITALNLIPIGQLDGGHILYTMIGKRAHLVAVLLMYGAVGYMIYSKNFAYALMLMLLMMMGPRHPPTADDNVPLGWFRILLGWLTLSFIIVGFTPTPIV